MKITSAHLLALASVLPVVLSAAQARAETPEIMMAICRNRAHDVLKIRLPDIDTKYEGQRTDGTHAVNGTATTRTSARTFQCTFERSGSAIVAFVVNDDAAPGQGRGQGPQAHQPDFADGFAGGPDFWQVAGVPAGDTLNVRADPSAGAAVLLKLDEGAVVRNLGCRPVGGARWCRIQLTGDADTIGWVNGRYLREASAPPQPADAQVPGTAYHATGRIDCRSKGDATDRTCRFGVVREGTGRARVDITFPDGVTRTLSFRDGHVTTSQPATVTIARAGDATVVTVDGTERFTVPDVVVTGD